MKHQTEEEINSGDDALAKVRPRTRSRKESSSRKTTKSTQEEEHAPRGLAFSEGGQRNVYLGVDVGLKNTGYAFLTEKEDSLHSFHDETLVILGCGVIETEKDEKRLKKIYVSWMDLMQTFQPTRAFVEKGFVNINSKTSLQLMSGQSTTLLALEMFGCPTTEFASTRIKKRVIGWGHASKEEVKSYVLERFSISCQDHIADAIITALAGLESLESQ